MENPQLLTFLWFGTLRKALFIVHGWAKAQRFHNDHGFYAANDTVAGGRYLIVTDLFPSHIPGQNTTLMAAFARYDQQFAARGMTLLIHHTILSDNLTRPLINSSLWLLP
jgi:hypothetical protein